MINLLNQRCQKAIDKYLPGVDDIFDAIDGERGFSNVGVVVGATKPKEAVLIRKILPKALFLIPGYGAQGARASDALAGLILKNKIYEGGLINSSRNILFPEGSYEQISFFEWKKTIESALKKSVSDLKKLSD